MAKDNEIKYLMNLTQVDFELELGYLNLPYNDGKVIIGVVGDHDMAPYFSCKTIVDTALNLDRKARVSFDRAIQYTYSDKVNEKFSHLTRSEGEEFWAFYYIENAMYRISSIWDSIAQLYNVYYDLKKEPSKIYYKSFFKNLSKADEKDRLEGVLEIHVYLEESDDTSRDGRWLGNHKYINEYRNKMTHRNSPEELSLSNYDFNMKPHPAYVLKRTMEDYNQAIKFLGLISKKALSKD